VATLGRFWTYVLSSCELAFPAFTPRRFAPGRHRSPVIALANWCSQLLLPGAPPLVIIGAPSELLRTAFPALPPRRFAPGWTTFYPKRGHPWTFLDHPKLLRTGVPSFHSQALRPWSKTDARHSSCEQVFLAITPRRFAPGHHRTSVRALANWRS